LTSTGISGFIQANLEKFSQLSTILFFDFVLYYTAGMKIYYHNLCLLKVFRFRSMIFLENNVLFSHYNLL